MDVIEEAKDAEAEEVVEEGPSLLEEIEDFLREFLTSEEDFELRIIVASSLGLLLFLIVLLIIICCLKKRAAKRRNEQDDVVQHDSTEESVEKYKMKRGPDKVKEKASQLRYKKSHKSFEKGIK